MPAAATLGAPARTACLATPVGRLRVAVEDDALVAIDFAEPGREDTSAGARARAAWEEVPAARADGVLAEALAQLAAWFRGERTDFDLPLAARGTPFQRAVWEALVRIPFGQTASYGDIARAVGRPGAARAVGMANHRNPIAIVVPCHRVIGQDGALVGYGGGLDLKSALLDHERRVLEARRGTGAARRSGR